jgi:WD40 repeat protein
VAGDHPGGSAQDPGEHEGEDLLAQRVSAGGDAYVAGRDMHVHLLPGGDGRLLAAAGLPDDLESPYKGLDAFRVKDAGLFFGRDREAEDILGRLAADGLLIVSGVSGAGKSSLLRAGVVPRYAGPHLVLTPTATPLDELANVVAELTGTVDLAVAGVLREAPERFAQLARQAAAVGPPGSAAPLLIVLDQFEETFTQCQDEDERAAFIAALHAAATTPLGPQRIPAARVALVVRADYETRCGSYPELADAAQLRYLLLPMSEGQLRVAITEPAEAVGSGVDPALTDLLVRQVRARARAREISPAGLRVGAAAGPEVLPLLSYALDQAWRQRAGDAVTLADYERTGGITESVAKSAEAAFSGLTADQQGAAQRMFIQLTVTGSDGTVSAARATRTAVAAGIPDDDVAAVLEAFSGPRARLITLGEGWAEISHEALLTAWERLAEWLNGDLDDRVRYGRLAADARTWKDNRQASSYLYPEGRLTEVEESAKRWAEAPERYSIDAVASGFLGAARRAVRRTRRRRRGVVAVLSALTLAAGAAAGAAWYYALNANQEQAIALSRQLANDSLSLDATNPIEARQLAVAAWQAAPTSQAREAMVTLLTEQEHDGEVPSAGKDGELPASAIPVIDAVDFSPDGRLLASVDGNGYIRIWNLATGALVTPPWALTTPGAAFSRNPWDLAFSPDDKLLASADPAGNVRLWDAANGHAIRTLARNMPPQSESTIAFSPNGAQLAITDNTHISVWNRATGKLGQRFSNNSPAGGRQDTISDITWDSQGDLLVATTYRDGNVQVWNALTEQPVGKILRANASAPNNLVKEFISPDDEILATFNQANGVIQLWSLATGKSVQRSVTSDPNLINTGVVLVSTGAALAINGSLVASPDGDGHVRLWNTAARTIRVLGSYSNAVAFSPNGRLLASAGTDGYVHLFSTATGSPIQGSGSFQTSALGRIAVDPDGEFLATDLSRNEGAELWNTTTGVQIEIGGPLTASQLIADDIGIAFSPNGRLLATVGLDSYARLWDVSRGTLLKSVPIPGELFLTLDSNWYHGIPAPLTFSPDGRMLAFGTGDASVGLWNFVGSTLTIAHLSGGRTSGIVTEAAPPLATALGFSRHGQSLDVADDYGYIQKFDATTGKPTNIPVALAPPSGSAGGTSFTSNGEFLAGIGEDDSIWIWNAENGKAIAGPLETTPDVGLINRVAFSPRSALLAGVSDNGYVQLWDAATGAPRGLLTIGNTADRAMPSTDGAVAFSQNGSVLAAVDDGTLANWQVGPLIDPYRTLCAEVGGPSNDLWRTYVNSEPQLNTCAGVSLTSVDMLPRLPLVSPSAG